MHKFKGITVLAAIVTMAACSSSKSPVSTGVAQANAEFARWQKQGADATAREITKIEYPAARSLMKAGGLDAALGGEAKADAALQGLFVLYEQKSRAFAAELPTLFDKRSGGGGGLGSGGYAGVGGMAASSVTAGIQNAAGEQAWEQAQEDGKTSGSYTNSDGTAKVDWTENSYTTTTTFEGNMPEGLKGKVVTKVKSIACPDAQGKIEVEFESTSDLSGGDGSAQTKVTSKLVKHLDDDANLIDDDMDSDVHVEQTTGSGSHVDVSDALSTTRGEMGAKVNGRSHGTSDEDVQLAKGLATVGRMAAMSALDAAKKAWESGRCVKLDVRSDPAKRTGAKPNTAYTLFAEPRAKSDGAPTRGTVKATLSGEHMLNPRDKKVPADAQFDYQNPEKKDQSATIDFEARSKRGVGKASLQFDTKKGGYRVTPIGNGGCNESYDVCDLDKPVTVHVCKYITLTQTPTGDKGGTYSMHFAGGGGTVDASGTYTLSGPEEKMTATYTTPSACGHAGGRTVCTPARTGTAIWTKVDDCGAGK